MFRSVTKDCLIGHSRPMGMGNKYKSDIEAKTFLNLTEFNSSSRWLIHFT